MQIGDIAEVEIIAKECNLSIWSSADYRWQLENKDGISLVVKDITGKIIGFLISRLIKINFPDLKCKPNSYKCELEIYNIGISPPHRSQGAGRILLNKCVAAIEKCAETIVRVEVRQSNVQARNFYLSNRFEICYARKNYYTLPTEDALVMKMIIGSESAD